MEARKEGKEGRKEERKKGRKEERKKGRKEGRKEGKDEKNEWRMERKKGMKEGRKEGKLHFVTIIHIHLSNTCLHTSPPVLVHFIIHSHYRQTMK